MRKFVIDRKTWLRGQLKCRPSKLLDEHGNQCCVGKYLSACGMADGYLMNVGSASSASNYKDLPDEAVWLLGGYYSDGYSDSMAAGELYGENDKYERQWASEKKIAAAFAKHDVEVKFTGSGVPDLKLYR